MDEKMFSTIAALKVPYIIMHMQGNPSNMQDHPIYKNVTQDLLVYFAKKTEALKLSGIPDVIIDPGFGFGKTLDHNYELLANLDAFGMVGMPVMVGLSRKSMIYKFFGDRPEDALNGTTVLHTIALLKGADILRVHDVKEAMQAIALVEKMNQSKK